MNNGYKKKFIIAAIFIGLMIVLRYVGFQKYLTLDFIKVNSSAIERIIKEHYVLSVLTFLMAFTITLAFNIPISILFTVISGYFFGTIPGALYSTFAATAGASIAFFMFRYLLAEGMRKRYKSALAKFESQFKQHGVSYLLFMQLLPVTPFALINILSGVSGIAWWKFALATAVGILPGNIVYTYAGQQLHTVNQIKDILSPGVVIALSLMAFLALVPIILKRINIIK